MNLENLSASGKVMGNKIKQLLTLWQCI